MVFISSAAQRLRSTSISSGTANSLLGFAPLHILANYYQPLKWALCFKDDW